MLTSGIMRRYDVRLKEALGDDSESAFIGDW